MAVSFAQTRPAFTVKNMYSLHFQCSWTLKTTDASFESNYQIENQMLFHPHTKKDRKKSIYFLHLFSCAHHHMHRTERCHSCEKKLLCMSTQHSAGGRWDCCVCMHVCVCMWMRSHWTHVLRIQRLTGSVCCPLVWPFPCSSRDKGTHPWYKVSVTTPI